MKIVLKTTTFIMLHEDGAITTESERAVAIDGVATEIQVDGFGAAQDWRGALRREGRSDLMDAVQNMLDAADGNGGAR